MKPNWKVRVTRKALVYFIIFVVALLFFFFRQTPIVANAAENGTENEEISKVELEFWYSGKIEADSLTEHVDVEKVSGTRNKKNSWTTITIKLTVDDGYVFDKKMKKSSAWDFEIDDDDDEEIRVKFSEVSRFDEDELTLKVRYHIDTDDDDDDDYYYRRNRSSNYYYYSYNHRDGWDLQENTWYYYKNGAKTCNTWRKIDGYWYYFNSDGSMRKGLSNSTHYKYYFNEWASDGFPEGAMVTGWKCINGSWYYFDSEGRMVRNRWVWGAYEYYLGDDGRMYTGWKYVDGHYCYFLEEGAYIGGCTTRQ